MDQPKDIDNKDKNEFVGRIGNGFGKPDLLAVNTNAKELCDLITPASWRFFKILEIPTDFL